MQVVKAGINYLMELIAAGGSQSGAGVLGWPVALVAIKPTGHLGRRGPRRRHRAGFWKTLRSRRSLVWLSRATWIQMCADVRVCLQTKPAGGGITRVTHTGAFQQPAPWVLQLTVPRRSRLLVGSLQKTDRHLQGS